MRNRFTVPMMRLAAVIAVWIALFACVSRAAIVEVSGAGEFVTAQMIQDFVAQCPNCQGKFYVNKATPGHDQDARMSLLIQGIDERANVVLSTQIQTNNPPFEQVQLPFNSPIGWELPGLPIPAGQLVNSHYIYLNAYCDSTHGCNIQHDIATFKFDGPIIGLIGGPADLNASNGPLGFDYVGYTPTVTGFVNERCFSNPTDPARNIGPSGDVVTKLAPAVLQVDFTSIAGDYVRVITAADVPLHAGDFDRDYDVDLADLAIWKKTFSSTQDSRGDANEDGTVDAADYVVWRRNVGYSYTFPTGGTASANSVQPAASLPEASTALFAMTGALIGAAMQRRRAS